MARLFIFLICVVSLGARAGDRPLENDLDRFAEDDAIPMVLTPARLRQPQSEVPASVTVIDRELIEASGARELYDLLKLVPGMGAAKVDGNVPTVAYHGSQARDDRRMLVLIDGRSVYQPGLARVLWNDLPISVDDVARIEVTRGPNSAAYGANAFSGVVNIITRHPRDVSGTTLETRHGNNGISDHRYTRGAARGLASVRFTIEQRNDDGYDDGYDPEYEDQLYRDAKTQNLANLRAAFDLSDRDSLEFLAGGSSTSLERPREDDFQAFASYHEPPQDNNERVFAQLRWQRQFSPTHSLRVEYYGQYFDSRQEMELCMNPFPGKPLGVSGVYFSRELRDVYLQTGSDLSQTENILIASVYDQPGADPALSSRVDTLESQDPGLFCGDFVFDVKEKRHDIEIEDTIHFGDRAKLVAGLNLRHDRAESETYLSGAHDNYSQRLFGTLEIKVAEPVLLNLGGFWEKEDISGEFFNPRGALIIKPLEGHSVRAVYSEAVRTSDIFEDQADTNLHAHNLLPTWAADVTGLLGWSDPRFFITQTSPGGLDPERIVSRELGYYGRFGALELDLRFFEEKMRELFTEAMNPFEFNPSRDEMDMSGWESQLTWRPHPDHLLRLTNAHIHQEASIKVLERFAPRDSGSFLWRYDIHGNLMLSAAYYLAHDWNRNGTSSEATLFERADLVAAYTAPMAGTRLRLEGKVQRYKHENPIVFEENRYDDQYRYWLSASLEF